MSHNGSYDSVEVEHVAHTDQYLVDHWETVVIDGKESKIFVEADYKFSASQISSWMSCHRLWAWTYLINLRGSSTSAQALGTRTHTVIENWLGGEPIDFTTEEGQIFASGLEHYPPPAHDLKVEQEFHIRARHHWWGFKDIEIGDTIWDNKTTSDLKWAKTPDQLKYDPQAVLYAKDNGSPVVNLKWVYMQTKKTRKSKLTHLPMLQSHAQQAFDCLEDAADEAYAVVLGAQGLDGDPLRAYVLSLPYEAGQCEAFGGCPHRGLCNLSPAERFRSKNKQANGGNKHMSLFDRMKAKNQADDSKAAAPVPTSGINPPEESDKPDTEALAKLKAEEFAAEQARVAAQDAVKAQEKTAKLAANKAAKAAEKAAKKASPDPEPDPPEPVKPVKTADQIAAAEGPQTTRTVAASSLKPVGYTLWLDCIPVHTGNVDCWPAELIFAEAKKRIQENVGLDDYRFGEFGSGPGILVQTVAHILDDNVAKFTNIMLDTRQPEAIVCLALLKNRATNINMSVK